MKKYGGKTFFSLWVYPFIALILFFPGMASGASNSGAVHTLYEQYEAELTYRDSRGRYTPVGTAFWLRSPENGMIKARLDFDLGKAGFFSAVLKQEEKKLFIVSHALSAYVDIPVQGDEHTLKDLLPSVTAAFMPFGVPALSLREEKNESLPNAFMDKKSCERKRIRYNVTFMGDSVTASLVEWSSSEIPFFPIRLDELETWDAPDVPRGSILLKNIRSGTGVLNNEIFRIPENFVRYGSAMNMLLYALAAQWQ